MSTIKEIEVLKEIPLFSTMGDAELSEIHVLMKPMRYLPGQVIIREGDAGDHFYIITEGTVEFITFDANHQELLLDTAGPGGFFGELSMLTGEPRVVRVRAREHVVTLALERNHFQDFLMKNPRASLSVLTVLARRLHRSDQQLRQSVTRNVNEIAEEKLTLGQRIADRIASVMGSWPFIIIQSFILMTWIVLNVLAWTYGWDPYPFILLNLALSFQSAYAAPIIMMSQNRQTDKDRLVADMDHQVNIKAEAKTGRIMSRLDDLEKAMHLLHKEQLAILEHHEIERKN